ncbi:MAG: flagellar basal-body MS-ring/collar protein FliF [Pseudomonadales bacterium]
MASMFGTSWTDMDNRTRGSMIGGVVLIVLLTVGAFFWLASEEYQVLFTDMEPRDAANVVSELERLKIDFQLANDGSQIQVPASSVHEVRLKLMGSGVPLVGGVGFEIFDNPEFGMTEFAQRINYQRALEGELTRTIMSLKEVKYARVHLVMPAKGLFQADDNPPSASVTLFLKQESLKQAFLNTDRRPLNGQIIGIQRLVAAAVSNLKVDQVTVSDQNGMTLSQQIPEQGNMALVSGRLQQKQAVENYFSKKVNDVLSRTFGAGQAMVSVDVELDFNEVKRTNEHVVTPENMEGSVIRRRETRLGNAASRKETDGNVTTDVEYRLGRSVEQIVETPGRILRLSVGVVVPKGTSAERRQEIQQLVEMTVGLNTARGDGIVVYTMDNEQSAATVLTIPNDTVISQPLTNQSGFTGQTEPQPATAVEKLLRQSLSRYPLGSVALGAIVILFLLFSLWRLGRRRVYERERLPVLSDPERKQALAKINAWMETSDVPASSEVV